MTSEDGHAGRPVSVRQSSPHLAREGEEEAERGAPAGPSRRFGMGDEEWIARRVGEGAVGTAGSGQAYLAAIRFFRAAEPDRPVRELLTARGRFEVLYEEELRELFHEARPLASDEPG